MNTNEDFSKIETIEQAMTSMCLSLDNPHELPGYGVHSYTGSLFRIYHTDGHCITLGANFFCSDMPGFTEISKTDFFDKFRLDFMNLLERKIESKERSMSFERIQNGSGYDYTDEYYFELQKETELLREIEFKLDEL